jgi:hypothetical protein
VVAVRSKTQVCVGLIVRIAGFESRWEHGISSLIFVVCCVGSGLCDELITRSEESYQACARARVCVCVSKCVMQPQQ